VTRAALAAGLAGALAVAGTWEALAAVETARVVDRMAGVLRAGRDGRDPAPPERRRLALLGAATLCAAGWLLAGPWAGLAAAALGPAVALRLVRARRERWRRALAAQAPAVCRALADSLGAGHAVRGAVGEAARGIGGPAGAELARAAAALASGARTDDAIEALRDRAGSEAWDAVAAAILLQRDAGGDLAGLLRATAAAQEDAARLARDARTATAQARFTGLVVCGLPLGAGALVELAAPGTVAGIAASPAGAILGGTALVLQAGCLLLIRRLGRVPA
jgi:tight adherence protein B